MEPLIKVNGNEYPLVTPDKLTLGEAADVERITGQGYDIYEGGALGLLALVYVSVKRVDATVTVDDIRMLNGDELDMQLDSGDVLPPEPSGGSSENAGRSTETSQTGSGLSPEPTPVSSGTDTSPTT